MKVSNELLISAIRNFINEEKELVPLLMSLLNLGKQSVYRRLRNEIPFTFEEVSILSSNIGFSIDEIISQVNKKGIIYELPQYPESLSQDLYIESRSKINQIFENARKSKDSRIIAATNRLPYIYTATFEYITKMEYYKWYQQQQDHQSDLSFGNFEMPSTVISGGKNMIYNSTNINDHTLILDHNMLKPIIKEINYYYRRGLVTENELSLLQDELLEVINDLESLTIKGHYKSGSEINIYLSSLNIGSNCVLLEYEHNSCFLVWISPTEPIAVFNNTFCLNQKKWLQSLKKYSTLITQCNEFSRSIFFKKQRDAVLRIKEEIGVYL